MVKFSGMVISGMLIGLFIICMFGLFAQFSLDNDINNTITQDANMVALYSNVDSSLASSQTQADNQTQGFIAEGSTAHVTTLGFFFSSIISAGNLFLGSTIFLIKNVLNTSEDAIGIPPVVIGTLVAISLVVLMFAAWRLLRAGE